MVFLELKLLTSWLLYIYKHFCLGKIGRTIKGGYHVFNITSVKWTSETKGSEADDSVDFIQPSYYTTRSFIYEYIDQSKRPIIREGSFRLHRFTIFRGCYLYVLLTNRYLWL